MKPRCTKPLALTPLAGEVYYRTFYHKHPVKQRIRPGERDPFVDAVLGEVGLSLGRHAPHSLDELEDDYFDLIVTLAPEAHHAALELTRSMAVDVMYWPTPDPAVATGTRDQILHSYREVREHLKLLIEKRLKSPA